MITALRGAIYEALKREEEILNMYERFSKEAKDKLMRDINQTQFTKDSNTEEKEEPPQAEGTEKEKKD